MCLSVPLFYCICLVLYFYCMVFVLYLWTVNLYCILLYALNLLCFSSAVYLYCINKAVWLVIVLVFALLYLCRFLCVVFVSFLLYLCRFLYCICVVFVLYLWAVVSINWLADLSSPRHLFLQRLNLLSPNTAVFKILIWDGSFYQSSFPPLHCVQNINFKFSRLIFWNASIFFPPITAVFKILISIFEIDFFINPTTLCSKYWFQIFEIDFFINPITALFKIIISDFRDSSFYKSPHCFVQNINFRFSRLIFLSILLRYLSWRSKNLIFPTFKILIQNLKHPWNCMFFTHSTFLEAKESHSKCTNFRFSRLMLQNYWFMPIQAVLTISHSLSDHHTLLYSVHKDGN